MTLANHFDKKIMLQVSPTWLKLLYTNSVWIRLLIESRIGDPISAESKEQESLNTLQSFIDFLHTEIKKNEQGRNQKKK
jgi:hypothetical protein